MDQPFMASLLYYFGVLTLGGQGILRQTILQIPNLVARALYVERLRERWLPTYEDRQTILRLAETVYLTGDLAPLVEFIEQRYFPILSNRDYRWSNELMVKLAFLTLLFDDRLYMMVSETEMDHGYIDLSLIVRTDRRMTQALDLLLEFKYVSLKDLNLTGAQVPAPQCLGQRQLCLGIQHLVVRHGIPFAAPHQTPLAAFAFSRNRIRCFLK